MTTRAPAPLSDRARLFLRLIDRYTEHDPVGRLARYWVPGERWASSTLKDGTQVPNIGGSGDAAILRGLDKRGLVAAQPNGGKYAYAITPAGHTEALTAESLAASTKRPRTQRQQEAPRACSCTDCRNNRKHKNSRARGCTCTDCNPPQNTTRTRGRR